MRKILLSLFFVFSAITATLFAQGPGCPSVNAGPDQTLPCNVTCTTLSATMFQTGATTSYTVAPIAYAPPAPSGPWVASFVNTDDIWSGVINLPFTFCYYGANYTQLVIGANGVISFNTAYANQFCPWSYTAAIPNATLPLNAIFGAYHDIDPSVCGNIRYAISGTFPCRTFMFDFDQVCHYSCNNLRTSQRIVLYETSNVIEVYIGNRPVCAGWNGGRAVIGIQNAAGDMGLTPMTRQTGAWAAANEGWRFTPSGAPNYTISWGSSTQPGVVGTGQSINVCPNSQFTTYSALLTYTNCNNAQVTVSDYVNVTMNSPAQPNIWTNAPICAGNTLLLTTNAVAGATYFWSGPGGWTSNAQNPTRPGSTTAMSGTYNLYIIVAGCTSSTATQTITILNNSVQPNFTTNSPICGGTTLMLNGPTLPGASYFWSGPGGWTSGMEDPTRGSATPAMSGVYSLYVVVSGCTSATATQNVVINAAPAAPAISSNSPVCTPNSINLFGPTIAGATYVWSGPGGWSSNLEDPTRPNANLNMAGTYSLYVVVAGCTSAVSTTNVVVNGPPIPTIDIPQQICQGQTANFYSGIYPGATYNWSGPNGFTSNLGTPVLNNVTTPATGTYSLYLTQAGCTSNTVTSYMEVVNTTAPGIGSNSPVCIGGTINLTTNTQIGATYTWNGPNAFTSTDEDPVLTPATAAMSGNYTLYVTVSGCSSSTATTAVTVNPIPTVNAVGNQTLCAGAASTAINFSGSVGGATYNWTNSNPAIGLGASGNGNIASFTATNAGTTPITSTVTVTPTAAGCDGTPITFTITVNPTPTVNAVGNQTICTGGNSTAINFGGPVAGTSFAWTNSNPAIGLGASGNGNIAAFTATNAGTTPITSTVTVTPTANGCPGTPATFTITVNPTPTVNAVANQTVCNGAATTAINFGGPVAGTSYAWTNSNPAIGLGTGGNGNIAAFTATNAGTTPITSTVTVTPTANACVGTPNTFTITVNPTPTVDNVPNQTLCNGANSTAVNFGGPVGGSTFAWTNSNPAIGLGASGNGNIAAFAATNAGTTPITSTVTVTPTANGCAGTPGTFTITVNPTPTVNAVTGQTVCNGATTTAVNFGGAVAGTTYAWTNSDPTIGLGAGGNGNIAAFTATNAGTTPITSTITVTPSAGGCTGTPTSFTITVSPNPTVNPVANQTVCNGATTTAVAFSGGVTGTTYNWTNSNPAIGLAASGNGNIAAFTATNAGTAPVTATITVTPTAAGCQQTPATFTITVNPTPTVNAVANQTICSGANSTAVNFGGAVTGTTYAWTNSNPAIGLGASGNGNIAAFAGTNAGTTPITSTVTVTPSANGCTGTPTTFTVTVNPAPVVNAVTGQTVCNGAGTTAVNFTGPVAGTTYAWTNSDAGIGLAASGNGNITAFTATNSGTAPVTATITATPSANGCAGTPGTFTITVNPTPTVNAVTNQTVCNGLPTAAVNFAGPVAGSTFAWTNSNPAIGLGASGNGNIAAFNGVNAGTAPVTGTVTVTPTANGCPGTPGTFTITVNPTPTVTAVTNQTLCNGSTTTAITFGGAITGTTYNWTNSNPAIGLAASGNGNIAAFTATNAGTAPVTANITVTPTINGCTGPAGTFTITVNPTPTVNAVANQTVCFTNPTAAVNFGGPVTGSTFAWTNSDPTIGLAASGNGNIPAFNTINMGSTPVTATITVTPTANGCPGTPGTFTITVNPTPTVGVMNPQVLCNGDASTAINFTGTVAGTNFAWTNMNTAIGLGASGNGNIPSFTATNAGSTPITSTVSVTPSANGCTGPTTSTPIDVLPTHVGAPVNATICDGETYNFGGQGFTTAGSYPVAFQNIYNCDSTVTLNLTVIPASGPPPAGDFFNTGTNGSGGTLPGGSADANWTVATGNINAPYVPASVMSSIPGNYYNSPWPDCAWISHSASGSHSVNTDYFYRIDFDLPCSNPCGDSYSNDNVFCLNLDFFADNSVYEIYVNGVPQSATIGNMPVANPYFATGFNQAGMVSVSLCQDWQPGGNSLVVQVVSGPGFAGFLSQMSVNPPPPFSDTSSTAICSGDTYTFGTQTLSTAGTYTETFHLPGGCDSIATLILTVNPTFTGTENVSICNGDTYSFGGQNYTTAGAYPVTFTTVNGCDSTVTLNLTVNPTYTSSFAQTICAGNSVTFGGNTYNATGSYPITFTTVNGCDSTVTLNLTVNPNPIVTIVPQASQCVTGNSFDFATVQAFTPAAAFNWVFVGSTTPTSTVQAPQNISYTTPGQYTAAVVVTENGCQSGDTITVTALDEPNVQFNALPPTGCVPLTVVLTNLTAGGGVISWDFGQGGAPSSASPATVTYTVPGTYTVQLTVTLPNGCSATNTAPGLINAQAAPVAGFTIHPTEVELNNPTASFINTSSGAASINYYIQNGPTLPGPNADYRFSEEGTYQVIQIVSSPGGCSDTAYGQLIVTGSTEVFIPNAFTPNSDPMNPGFGVVGNGFTDFHMMVFNRWGEMLFESRDSDEKWDGTYRNKPVPPEVYVYKVELRDYRNQQRSYIGSVTLVR